MKNFLKKISFLILFVISSQTFSLNLLPTPLNNQCYLPNILSIKEKTPALNIKILSRALKAYKKANQEHIIKNCNVLTIIDYTKPSNRRRLWVINLENSQILIHTYVAHGKGSGVKYADYFSDKPRTDASSIGTFLTGNAYYGKHGYSLKIIGLEKGFNDKALQRDIVIHRAWYASHKFLKEHDRLGRSWGCPALNKRHYRQVINLIKNGSILFSYYPDKKWLTQSTYLN